MKKFNMQDPRFRGARYFFLIAVLALLGACSSLKLAYNNGDTLLFWWLDAYVDVTSDQKPEVKEDINDLFRWHRKTQLQDYTQVLRTAQKQLQGNVTMADLQADYREIRGRTETVMMKAVPDLAELALKLTPEQINRLEKKFDKNNVDFRKKNMKGDRSDQLKFRYKKSMEQFELWFGDFSKEQEAAIRKASDARPLDNELWLDERMRRQKGILELVRKIQQQKPPQPAAEAMIRELLKENFDRMEKPSDRKPFFDAYQAGTLELVHTVIRIATPEQKLHAHKRMQGWIDDLNTLAVQAK
ncbi:DUF6279 family lipoprotein [Pseudoduganella namucuonensis]|uniref:Lipoprotein n=1 Tax=Pseudoduganella namucuonensis TaxID=1035707 RepID=A0A1I7G7M9_9BURK|nr:DUF6279 family lipoprotein [Pseudoduganella namucuonensis]SFU44423.1 hypothetical protein SAMN05216552_1003111 [Pseudoduganella namucuonensis]